MENTNISNMMVLALKKFNKIRLAVDKEFKSKTEVTKVEFWQIIEDKAKRTYHFKISYDVINEQKLSNSDYRIMEVLEFPTNKDSKNIIIKMLQLQY